MRDLYPLLLKTRRKSDPAWGVKKWFIRLMSAFAHANF